MERKWKGKHKQNEKKDGKKNEKNGITMNQKIKIKGRGKKNTKKRVYICMSFCGLEFTIIWLSHS